MSRNKELWEAVAYNKAAEVMKQLAGGADPNWPNDGAGGSTAMHQAASKGQVEILKELLEAGGRVDVKISKGKTPLDLARQFKKDECVKLLTHWAAGQTAEKVDAARARSAAAPAAAEDAALAAALQAEEAQARVAEFEDVGAGSGLARAASGLVGAVSDLFAAPAPPMVGRQTTADLIQQAIDISLGVYEPGEAAAMDPAVQAARARRHAARDAIAERLLDSASFGPFGLVPLEAATLGLVVNPGGLTYSLDTSTAILAQVRGAPGVHEFGELSPRAALWHMDMGEAARAARGLPEAAQYVQYAYPLVGMHDCAHAEELDMASPANNLAALGGFLYYDAADAAQPCLVHAFVGDAAAAEVGFDAGQVVGALSFAGPFSLDPLEIGERLWEGGRVHDIVDDAVASRGVRKFGWIAPGEAISRAEDEGGEVLADGAKWPHGAFVFQYNNRLLDCYFAVQVPPAVPADAAAAAAAVPPAAQEEGLDALSDELRELRAHVAKAEGDAAELERLRAEVHDRSDELDQLRQLHAATVAGGGALPSSQQRVEELEHQVAELQQHLGDAAAASVDGAAASVDGAAAAAAATESAAGAAGSSSGSGGAAEPAAESAEVAALRAQLEAMKSERDAAEAKAQRYQRELKASDGGEEADAERLAAFLASYAAFLSRRIEKKSVAVEAERFYEELAGLSDEQLVQAEIREKAARRHARQKS